VAEGLTETAALRREVINAPSIIPKKVKVKIRFQESRSCIREYLEFQKKLMMACLDSGACMRTKWYEPYKCIMFRAEALVGDRMVAVGYLYLILNYTKHGLIYDLYVARAWRRKGIGSALVKAAILYGKKINSPKIKAIVPDEETAEMMRLQGIDVNPEACEKLLKKLGFIERGDGVYMYYIRYKPRFLKEKRENT